MSETIDSKTGEIIEVIHKLPPMPAEIAKAIVAVKKQVKKLGYDDKNDFQKYPFVSIDKFLDVVGRLEAEAGLIVVLDEVFTDIKEHQIKTDRGDAKSSAWLHANYEVWIYHESGTSYGPIHRKVIVVASGAQAFGSAQSYLLKQFQRALYSIPTGDKDADADPQEQSGSIPGRSTPPPPKTPQEQSSAQQFKQPLTTAEPKPATPAGMTAEDREKHNATYNEIRRAIAGARTVFDVNKLMQTREADLRSLDAVGFSVAVTKLKDSAKARVDQLTPADQKGDPRDNEEIPS